MSLFCSTENHLLNPLQTAREWIQSVCRNGSFVPSLELLGFKPLTSKRKWKLLACFGGFASLGPCSGQTSVDSQVLLVVFVSWWVVERISFVSVSSETRSTSSCSNKRWSCPYLPGCPAASARQNWAGAPATAPVPCRFVSQPLCLSLWPGVTGHVFLLPPAQEPAVEG